MTIDEAYRILGLEKSDTEESIKKAFRRLLDFGQKIDLIRARARDRARARPSPIDHN